MFLFLFSIILVVSNLISRTVIWCLIVLIIKEVIEDDISPENLDDLGKLVDIYKDVKEVECMNYGNYNGYGNYGNYGAYGNYNGEIMNKRNNTR